MLFIIATTLFSCKHNNSNKFENDTENVIYGTWISKNFKLSTSFKKDSCKIENNSV